MGGIDMVQEKERELNDLLVRMKDIYSKAKVKAEKEYEEEKEKRQDGRKRYSNSIDSGKH